MMIEEHRLKVASEDAVESIRQLLKTASSASTFLAFVEGTDLLGNSDYTYDSSTVVDGLPNLSGFGSSASDVDAAIAIYSWLGPLTPAVAQDRRLWTYLTFVTLRDYVEARWPLDGSITSKWQKRAEERWLYNASSLDKLTGHALSRLWWAARLTQDPDKQLPLSMRDDDEWAYLRLLFKKQDTYQAVTQRTVGSIRVVRLAVLEYLDAHELTETDVRVLMKEIDLTSGFKELASLDLDQARALIDTTGEFLKPWGRKRS